MINKILVKKRFQKSLNTYDENAIVQKQMAEKLISLLPRNKYNCIFEVGCATGILTHKIKKKINFEFYSANDIVEDSKPFIDKIIPGNQFIYGDIEEIKLTSNYDLIISNACLQWCSKPNKTISNLIKHLNNKGVLAISIFGDSNLCEITNILDINNKDYLMSDIKNELKKYNVINYLEENIELFFNTPKDILKHLKLTGVNSVSDIHFTKSTLKEFEDKYRILYKRDKGYILTYNPVYIIISTDK